MAWLGTCSVLVVSIIAMRWVVRVDEERVVDAWEEWEARACAERVRGSRQHRPTISRPRCHVRFQLLRDEIDEDGPEGE